MPDEQLSLFGKFQKPTPKDIKELKKKSKLTELRFETEGKPRIFLKGTKPHIIEFLKTAAVKDIIDIDFEETRKNIKSQALPLWEIRKEIVNAKKERYLLKLKKHINPDMADTIINPKGVFISARTTKGQQDEDIKLLLAQQKLPFENFVRAKITSIESEVQEIKRQNKKQ